MQEQKGTQRFLCHELYDNRELLHSMVYNICWINKSKPLNEYRFLLRLQSHTMAYRCYHFSFKIKLYFIVRKHTNILAFTIFILSCNSSAHFY